jgi:hypothetical protein
MNLYCLLADAIAVLHFAIVAFVVLGMAAILAGVAWRWKWVRNFWFRAIHLATIGAVVAESLCGIACPLTNWEDRLREAGGGTIEPGSFVGRLVHSLLFVDLSPAVLCVCYVVFGVAVLLVFVVAPPRWPRKT